MRKEIEKIIVVYEDGKRIEFKNRFYDFGYAIILDPKIGLVINAPPKPQPLVATGLMDALRDQIGKKVKTKVVLPYGGRGKTRAKAKRKKVRRAKNRHAK